MEQELWVRSKLVYWISWLNSMMHVFYLGMSVEEAAEEDMREIRDS